MPQNPAKPVVELVNDAEATTEVLSSAILTIAEGIKKLRAGKLSDRALLLLIQDNCGERIGLEKIRMVLDAMGGLKRFIK